MVTENVKSIYGLQGFQRLAHRLERMLCFVMGGMASYWVLMRRSAGVVFGVFHDGSFLNLLMKWRHRSLRSEIYDCSTLCLVFFFFEKKIFYNFKYYICLPFLPIGSL